MTKRIFSACAVGSLLAASAFAAAGTKHDIVAAAEKLTSAPNYTWTESVDGGPGASDQVIVQRDGLTYVNAQFRDGRVEIYFRHGKGAVKIDGKWQSLDESSQDTSIGNDPAQVAFRLATHLRSPAALAEDLADKAIDLTETDGAYTGQLSPDAALGLMHHGSAAKLSNVTGSVQFWTADGTISKIRYTLNGTINIDGTDHPFTRATTIKISDVGESKIDVPAEAKKKIG